MYIVYIYYYIHVCYIHVYTVYMCIHVYLQEVQSAAGAGGDEEAVESIVR